MGGRGLCQVLFGMGRRGWWWGGRRGRRLKLIRGMLFIMRRGEKRGRRVIRNGDEMRTTLKRSEERDPTQQTTL